MTTINTVNSARRPIAIGVAAAIALSGAFAFGAATPVNAAPLSVSQTAVKEAVPDNVIDVRRRHYGGHAVAGLALGIIGAAIAHKAYKRHYRHHYHHGYYQPHYYGGGYYGGGYYGGPACIRRHGAWYCR